MSKKIDMHQANDPSHTRSADKAPGWKRCFDQEPRQSYALDMRALALIILTTICLFSPAKAEPVKDPENLASLMAGEYTVIGKRPNSKSLYLGHLSFEAHGKKLAFVRTINGHTMRGTAYFDTITADDLPVLQVDFRQAGQPYRLTYMWQHDADNGFDFTGYMVPLRTKAREPGLETLFRIPVKARW